MVRLADGQIDAGWQPQSIACFHFMHHDLHWQTRHDDGQRLGDLEGSWWPIDRQWFGAAGVSN
jgi:hypothetical protein